MENCKCLTMLPVLEKGILNKQFGYFIFFKKERLPNENPGVILKQFVSTGEKLEFAHVAERLIGKSKTKPKGNKTTINYVNWSKKKIPGNFQETFFFLTGV